MSQFTTPLILKHLPTEKWEVWEEFTYHIGSYPSDRNISVPKGFVTDMASVPRFLWFLLPPFGKYGKAAVLHDFMYKVATMPKKECDNIFLEAMTVLGVPNWKRKAMYYAVRLFGKSSYNG